ncbi:hypothetical protein QTO34_000830 [Cnephaeus nilssonii]|uniref:MAGE domain-containing protein n=1 Tax=Cnephaeus nilssonii TaxID=3371016 RepID=A0AA40ID92_CNENI|nr:hypothetical protein QTO34_000830 [Eptesicus nilssonii]
MRGGPVQQGRVSPSPDFLSRLLPAVPDYSDIMPGRHKSKKRHRAQIEPQSCGNAQATAAAAKEFPPSFSTQCEDIAGPGSDKASSSQDEDEAVFSVTPLSVVDGFKKRTEALELFLLSKYKLKQPIMKKDLLRIVGEDYQDRFCEMLKNASDEMETFFALHINEVDSRNLSYSLVSKLKLPNNGRQVYPGKKHFVFGEPRKLITDFVRLKYLECHQVPDSHPPRSEFLWGPKAHLETSKMEVLEFCAKVNGTHPRAYPSCYEEALRDEEERARARDAARAATTAQVRAAFRAMASTTFPPIEKSKAFRPSHQNI